MQPLSPGAIAGLGAMMFLLLCSALISGSEVAFFSLTPRQLKEVESSGSKSGNAILELLAKPRRLLATVLIANNFVNVAIIILSTFITSSLFYLDQNPLLAFIVQVVVVTFLILLLGEVIPKVYATRHALQMAELMAFPLLALRKLFNPLIWALISSTSLIEKRFRKKAEAVSPDELSHALELTSTDDATPDDQKILEGIVRFGSIDVKQVMRGRLDIVATEYHFRYDELLSAIREHGYSRMPVYKESFDNIVGVLYIKDLLPFLDQGPDFRWRDLIREPFFVPENKKIDDLLKEFQERKIHMAVVVDEYGGTSGLVTLEDIIEEIVGEITDEFDEEDIAYSKLDENNFVFEGKILLNDMYRVLGIDGGVFEAEKGDSDTLAGFILELSGRIPEKNEKVGFRDYLFTIEASDRRRIKRVKVTVEKKELSESKAEHGKKENGNGARLLPLIALILIFSGCGKEYSPKPKGHIRIDLPEKAYTAYQGSCPFFFFHHRDATVVQDQGRLAEECWLNVFYPRLNCTVHLSYREVEDNVREYMEDARLLAYKHVVKADDIIENRIRNDSARVYGLAYDFEGNAASSFQFYLTDSTKHFLRGALYFNVPPNADSLAPVIHYVKQDLAHFINTFRWK